MIIMLSGRAGVGKSTIAKHLHDYFEFHGVGCYLVPLAYQVKKIAFENFGWDGKKDDKGRQLLINIGTVTGRQYDPDLWCKYVLKRIESVRCFNDDVFIIDDWRFPNEYEFFKTKDKVITVRIERPSGEILRGTPYYNDISETSLPTWDNKFNSAYYNYAYVIPTDQEECFKCAQELGGFILKYEQ